MNKEAVILAREIIKEYQESHDTQVVIQHDEKFSFFEECEKKICYLEDMDIIKKHSF